MQNPEQKIKELIDFTQVALAFIEAVKNPKAVETLKASLIDAVAMSEAKKKEAVDADVAIKESNRIIAIAEKKLNDVEVARGFANQQAEIQKQDTQRALAELEGERATIKVKIDKHEVAVSAHKAMVEAAQDALDARKKSLDAQQTDLNVQISNLNAGLARLSEGQAALAAGQASLKAEEDKFTARKNKLAAMAAGDEL